MNRYKMDNLSSNVPSECVVSVVPLTVSFSVSKLESSKQRRKLVGISEVKRRQSKRLLVKSNKSRDNDVECGDRS